MAIGAVSDTKASRTTISGAAISGTIKLVSNSSQASETKKPGEAEDSSAEVGKDKDGNKTGTQAPKTDAEKKAAQKRAVEIAALRDSIPGGREIPKGKDLVALMKQDPSQFKGIDDQPKSRGGSASSSPDPTAQANAAGSAGAGIPGAGGAGGAGFGGGGSGGGWSGAGAQPHSHGGNSGGVYNPGTGGIGGGGHHHASPEVFTDVAKYQQHFNEEGGTVKFNDQKVTINGQEFYTGIHTTRNNQEHPILASVNVVDQSRLAIDSTNSHSTGQAEQLTASNDANQITNEAAQAAAKEPPPPPAPPPIVPDQGTQTA